jgi:hypothetical protein
MKPKLVEKGATALHRCKGAASSQLDEAAAQPSSSAERGGRAPLCYLTK